MLSSIFVGEGLLVFARVRSSALNEGWVWYCGAPPLGSKLKIGAIHEGPATPAKAPHQARAFKRPSSP